MKHQIALATLAVSLSLSPALAQKADPAVVAQHIAAATAAAKSDLLGPLALCKTATRRQGPTFFDNYKAVVNGPPLEPMRVMDELYFLGAKWSTAWAIKTSAGIIIINSMDNANEARNISRAACASSASTRADIKYVVVSHAHGDHYGGAGLSEGKIQSARL